MPGIVEQMTAKYYEFAPGLKAYLIKSGCTDHQAEDIVQEAFYRAFKHQMLPFRRIKNLRPWLYKVSYNLFMDLKRRTRELPTDRELEPPGREDDCPGNSAVSKEQGMFAREALDLLPQGQRDAVLLCIVSELTYAEAAQVMNVSEDSVRGLLYRGRIRLKEEFRKLEGGEDK